MKKHFYTKKIKTGAVNRAAKYNRLFQCLVLFLVVILGYPSLCLAGTITGTVTWRGVQDNQDVVVYLERVTGEYPPLEEPHVLDQKEMVFIPHVLPILKGEKVAFHNNDPFLHNVHVHLGRETLFNLAMYKSAKPRVKTFESAGEHVVLCDVHPEMEAWIIVLENPYFAITKEDGNYKIENVPEGTYTLKAWHKKLKPYSQEITVTASETAMADIKLLW